MIRQDHHQRARGPPTHLTHLEGPMNWIQNSYRHLDQDVPTTSVFLSPEFLGHWELNQGVRCYNNGSSEQLLTSCRCNFVVLVEMSLAHQAEATRFQRAGCAVTLHARMSPLCPLRRPFHGIHISFLCTRLWREMWRTPVGRPAK